MQIPGELDLQGNICIGGPIKLALLGLATRVE